MLPSFSLIIHSFKSNKYNNISNIINGYFIGLICLLTKTFDIHWCTKYIVKIKLFVGLLYCYVCVVWIDVFGPVMVILCWLGLGIYLCVSC
jgi:hypothetical protein